jgi:hypothetical protein
MTSDHAPQQIRALALRIPRDSAYPARRDRVYAVHRLPQLIVPLHGLATREGRLGLVCARDDVPLQGAHLHAEGVLIAW